jgi:hypothetical protein
MTGPRQTRFGGRRAFLWIAFGLVLLSLILLVRSELPNGQRPLKPLRTTATTGPVEPVSGQAISISFIELNGDPDALRDRRIRVSGEYTVIAAEPCHSRKGPDVRWALIADDLRLGAVGFERVLRLVRPGIFMTVEGVWRLYEGLVGCGKAPPVETVWYLEVEQVVQPNPLVGETGNATDGTVLPGLSPSIGEATPEAVVPTTMTPVLSGTPHDPYPAITGTVSPTEAAIPDNSPTAVDPGGNGSATSTLLPQTATVAATASLPVTAISTGTALPGDTATPVPSATGGPTSPPFPTSPPLATATPGGGYPGPVTTVTPTPTPGSYP